MTELHVFIDVSGSMAESGIYGKLAKYYLSRNLAQYILEFQNSEPDTQFSNIHFYLWKEQIIPIGDLSSGKLSRSSDIPEYAPQGSLNIKRLFKWFQENKLKNILLITDGCILRKDIPQVHKIIKILETKNIVIRVVGVGCDAAEENLKLLSTENRYFQANDIDSALHRPFRLPEIDDPRFLSEIKF